MPSTIVRYPGSRAAFLATLALAFGWLLPGTTQAAETAFACENEPTDEVLDYGDIIDCTIGNLSDRDIFRWSGKKDEQVWIRTRALTGGVEPCFTVFDSKGASIASSSCRNHGDVVQGTLFTLPKNGTYTVRTFDKWADETGQYLLFLERLLPASPTAKPIAGFGITESDQIDLLGDPDFFLIEAGGNETLEINSRALTGGVEPCMWLYDPTGTQIATSACRNHGDVVQAISTTLTMAGTHILWLEDKWSDETGNYLLTVDCLFGICPAQGGLRDALDIGIVMDFDGTAADEMAALTLDRKVQNDGTIEDRIQVRIKDMGDRSKLNTLFFSKTAEAIGMVVVPDVPVASGNGVDEIAVLLVFADGSVRVKIKDADTSALVRHLFYFPPDWDARAIILVEDMNANGSWEIGVLAVNRTTHAARLKIKDPETSETLANILQ